MTDLVERLGRGCNCGKCKMDLCCCHTMEEAKDRIKALEAALRWYGEQARLARLIHSEGDAGRQALAKDGGAKALAALEATNEPA